MKRIDFALLIGLVFSIALSSLTGFASRCEALRSEVVRLHILANSDSGEDQALKYKVRDRLLENGGLLLAGSDAAQAKELAGGRLADIERAAREVIAENGYTYEVSAQLVNMYFPTRIYGDTAVAAGCYDAVRVVIGEGKGRNWWCVMFPPMCLPAASKGSARAEAVRADLEEIGGTPHFQAKLAVVELVERLREHLHARGKE